jgi:hypothetical protein
VLPLDCWDSYNLEKLGRFLHSIVWATRALVQGDQQCSAAGLRTSSGQCPLAGLCNEQRYLWDDEEDA